MAKKGSTVGGYAPPAMKTPTPVPTPDYDAIAEEAKKRAVEPTGGWRKRQGKGKPKWWESEY